MEVDFIVDPEFATLLDEAESWRDAVLLDMLLERGVMDSLKVWDEENILLDGHRRLRLCQQHPEIVAQHGPPVVTRHSCRSREEARQFAIAFQNGRRNCSKVARAVVDGLTVQDKRGANQHTGPSGCYTDVTSTADRVENHRNKQAAEGWQAVADVSPEAGRAILSDDDTPVTQKDLRDVAKAEGNAKTAIATQVADKALRKPHVSHNSGENEWYTPSEYIDAARQVMGEITLDPATSELANKTVQAAWYLTKDDDGLAASWEHPERERTRRQHGERAADDVLVDNCVWLNPPYAQPLISQFADKLCAEWESGHVTQACVLVNNAMETKWFRSMAEIASAICFPTGRIKFIDTLGQKSGAPLQGQAVLYIGDREDAFCQAFSQFGFVVRCD